MRNSVTMQRTASATLGVGYCLTAAATPRRFKLYELICGSEATPADNAFLWQVNRVSTIAAGAGAAANVVPLDFSDTVTSSLVVAQAITTNPTQAAIVLTIPLNQRATFRWVAAPGSELVSSNAVSNGYSLMTPTAGGLVAVSATILVDEQ